MNYEILLAFILATAALAITPGPDNLYVLMQSVVYGKRYGLATTAGLITGCLVHTGLLAFGVSAIIKTNDNLFLALKIGGACYLFYLAWQVYTSKTSISLNNTIVKKSMFQLFRQGFIMNVLNPKVALFFLSFFPGFLFSKGWSTTFQFFVLGLLFMVVSTFVFSAIAILSSKISSYLTNNNVTVTFFKWLQIVVFVGIAVFILISDK